MKKRKVRLKSSVIVIFIIICLCVAIYSCYKVFVWKHSVDRNEEIKDKIDDSIIIVEEEKEEDKYKVDFNSLKEQNADTVAYLKVNNTNIDYAVVRGNDNQYYLKHNFNKEWNFAGWIFSDYRNKFDGTDKNIVIFGHSMKNGSMFGTLKNVLNKQWQENEENLHIVLVTENYTSLYQVFSTYIILAEDYYINTEFSGDDEFSEFIRTIKSRSNYDYNIEVNSSDSILTLSSCIGDLKKRVVLHAKKIN